MVWGMVGGMGGGSGGGMRMCVMCLGERECDSVGNLLSYIPDSLNFVPSPVLTLFFFVSLFTPIHLNIRYVSVIEEKDFIYKEEMDVIVKHAFSPMCLEREVKNDQYEKKKSRKGTIESLLDKYFTESNPSK
jgi:hypothetical protein